MPMVRSNLIFIWLVVAASVAPSSIAMGQCTTFTVPDSSAGPMTRELWAIPSFENDGRTVVVRILRRVGLDWEACSIVPSPLTDRDDSFASSIALTDEWLAVVGRDAAPVARALVYMYRRVELCAWELHSVIEDPTTQRSGQVVLFAGSTLVLASPVASELSGAITAYEWDGTRWSKSAELANPEGQVGSLFGIAVAGDGDRLAVGATAADGERVKRSGAVYLYAQSGGQFEFLQTLRPSNPAFDGRFGGAVAIQGDRLAVGSIRQSAPPGAVYVFEPRGDEHVWDETVRLESSMQVGLNTGLGQRVVMFREGTIIIGSATSDSEAGPGAGALHVFEDVGDRWVERDKVLPAPGIGGFFGSSLFHDRSTIAVSGLGGAAVFEGLGGADCDSNGVVDLCEIDAGAVIDRNGNWVPDQCEVQPYDIDGDGVTAWSDLLLLLTSWGDCLEGVPCAADGDGNGVVDTDDVVGLVAAWSE